MIVKGTVEGTEYEIDNSHVFARHKKAMYALPLEDIERLWRILSKQKEIERLVGEIAKIADGTEGIAPF